MDSQIIIVCDDQGKPNGEYIPKEVGHTDQGVRHLAITVLLENSRGEVLLQKRKHKIFDDIWDLTGATHPLHLEEKDEDFWEATRRCLLVEYEIDGEIELGYKGSFNYFAQYKDGLCENEHCVLMMGEYDGEIKLNDQVGYGCKWMKKTDLLEDIKQYPSQYSPWAVEAVKLLI